MHGVIFAHIGESIKDKSFELINGKNQKLVNARISRLSESYGKLRELISGTPTSTSIFE